MKRAEADKKLRSILFLVLGNEDKRVFSLKNPGVNFLSISFYPTPEASFFYKPRNVTFERYKLSNRKQKYKESFEKFWGTLTNIASTCKIIESDEAEWIRDVFICNK